MKRALMLLLLVPAFAQAGTVTIRSADDVQKAESENAIVVSRVIVESRAVVTYYNETTEQVCTYATSTNGSAPSLTCVFLHSLNDAAQDKVKARAALRLN